MKGKIVFVAAMIFIAICVSNVAVAQESGALKVRVASNTVRIDALESTKTNNLAAAEAARQQKAVKKTKAALPGTVLIKDKITGEVSTGLTYIPACQEYDQTGKRCLKQPKPRVLHVKGVLENQQFQLDTHQEEIEELRGDAAKSEQHLDDTAAHVKQVPDERTHGQNTRAAVETNRHCKSGTGNTFDANGNLIPCEGQSEVAPIVDKLDLDQLDKDLKKEVKKEGCGTGCKVAIAGGVIGAAAALTVGIVLLSSRDEHNYVSRP
ncbi:MAG: hypothetical protein Q8M83_06285 [bacterium]|nr:hypothetical protein [bacterium]